MFGWSLTRLYNGHMINHMMLNIGSIGPVYIWAANLIRVVGRLKMQGD